MEIESLWKSLIIGNPVFILTDTREIYTGIIAFSDYNRNFINLRTSCINSGNYDNTKIYLHNILNIKVLKNRKILQNEIELRNELMIFKFEN